MKLTSVEIRPSYVRAGWLGSVNILFLCKRRPQNRDLMERPYGRFFNIPDQLAAQGHNVQIILADYRLGRVVQLRRGGVNWVGVPVLPNPFRYQSRATEMAREMQVDWIVGFSDTWYGILASRLASRLGCRYLVDAYDNYESYLPWATPLHHLWRRAIANADVVTAAGPGLLDHMVPNDGQGVVRVVPMAADPGFTPLDKVSCREILGLPQGEKLIGYCGSAVRSRGIELFYSIIQSLANSNSDLVFVFSGVVDTSLKLPRNAIHVGYLDDDKMPALINAMDVAIAFNLPSAFGEHSHPVKVYEAVACGVPVLASRTRATQWIMQDQPERLFDNSDPVTFVEKLLALLDDERSEVVKLDGWGPIAAQFAECLGSDQQ